MQRLTTLAAFSLNTFLFSILAVLLTFYVTFVLVNSDSEKATTSIKSNSPIVDTNPKANDVDESIKKSEPNIVFVYKNNSVNEDIEPAAEDVSLANDKISEKFEEEVVGKDNDILDIAETIKIETDEVIQHIVVQEKLSPPPSTNIIKETIELKNRIKIAIKENTSFITQIKNPKDSIENTIFSIEDNFEQLFIIDPNQGLLSFVNNIDHERPMGFSGTNVYFIKISMETESQKIIQPVSILVENINDNEPKFINADIFNIEENTQFIANVKATDADGDPITYSIKENPDNMFSIDSITGTLTFVNAPDYEHPFYKNTSNRIMLEVGANDGERESLQLVTINIVNANDETPVITSKNTIRVFENYGVLHQITARDTYTDKLTYFIKNDPSNLFSINDTSGLLTFIGSTDYEDITNVKNSHQYHVEVGVSNGRHSTSQTLALELKNLNDNKPLLTNDSNISALDIGGDITQLTAMDLDNDEISYKIVGGNDQELFSLNQYSGILKFNKRQELNRNSNDNHHKLKVSVSDGLYQTEKVLNITVKQPVLVSKVNILDRGLARCIQSQNKKYVHEIVTLTCVDKGIKILMGLDNFTYLQTLNLAGNNIKYINPIANLKSLENLNLNDNFVSNIDALNGLSKLVSLELAINGISDITSLSPLANLKFLDISENRQLQIIDTIASLKNLIYLDLSNNKRISAFDSLVQLHNLEFIGIAYSKVNDLLMLQPLKKLVAINLQSKQVEKLEPFKTLNHLKWMSIVNSELEDGTSNQRSVEAGLNFSQS